MRTIKLRGKRKDNGEWVYGGYFQNSEEDGLFYYIFSDYGGAYKVIPESVGQFTGLLDKNGKEIYENDILKKGKVIGKLNGRKPDLQMVGSIKKVIFREGGYYLTKSNNSGKYHLNSVTIRYYQLEIIGNLTDNPELLNKNSI